VTFDVAADAYQRFMGRYADPLAQLVLGEVRPHPPQRALDVGAGPGALTAPLVAILGADAVAAIDPSASFVDALRERVPGVDVRLGRAEDLPFPDGGFDLALSQLVVHFMSDPVRGLAEMARVTRPGGIVAATAWDFGGDRSPLALFWSAARDLDPNAGDESELPGARAGHLAELFTAAGLHDVRSGELTVAVPYDDPDTWWQPYTLGVGPVGEYVATLDEPRREALRARCMELLGPGPGVIEATAWFVMATSPPQPR
jgi:SAM-dependent methyltransferase